LGFDHDGAATKPFDGGQDVVGGCGPAEGLRVSIAGVDVGRGYMFLDGVEEAAEFLRPVARHAFADDGSGVDIAGGKERGRPVPLIVMSAPFGLPWSHWQQRLGAIGRLDLRFLIDAEHERVVRRVEIAHLVNEEGTCRQLEGFAAVRLQRERPLDAMHGRD
jgi:hypothetical protein